MICSKFSQKDSLKTPQNTRKSIYYINFGCLLGFRLRRKTVSQHA